MKTELEVTPAGEQGEWRVVPEPLAPVLAAIYADGLIIASCMTTEVATRIVRDRTALDAAIPALKGVAIMLNTELSKYESEPWAQRVRAALALVDDPQRETK